MLGNSTLLVRGNIRDESRLDFYGICHRLRRLKFGIGLSDLFYLLDWLDLVHSRRTALFSGTLLDRIRTYPFSRPSLSAAAHCEEHLWAFVVWAWVYCICGMNGVSQLTTETSLSIYYKDPKKLKLTLPTKTKLAIPLTNHLFSAYM